MYLADVTFEDVLTILARCFEIMAGLAITCITVWWILRTKQQDVRKAKIQVDADEYKVAHERDEDERKAKQEERDHTIEELRGLIEEAKADAREAKRDLKRSQEMTAKKIAEAQTAHHECEKHMAAQTVQLTHFREVLDRTREELAEAQRRIHELETRSNGATPNQGDSD